MLRVSLRVEVYGAPTGRMLNAYALFDSLLLLFFPFQCSAIHLLSLLTHRPSNSADSAASSTRRSSHSCLCVRDNFLCAFNSINDGCYWIIKFILDITLNEIRNNNFTGQFTEVGQCVSETLNMLHPEFVNEEGAVNAIRNFEPMKIGDVLYLAQFCVICPMSPFQSRSRPKWAIHERFRTNLWAGENQLNKYGRRKNRRENYVPLNFTKHLNWTECLSLARHYTQISALLSALIASYFICLPNTKSRDMRDARTKPVFSLYVFICPNECAAFIEWCEPEVEFIKSFSRVSPHT